MKASYNEPILIESIPNALAVYSLGNLLVAYWIQPPTAATVEALAQARAMHIASHPEGTSLIHIPFEKSGNPDAPTRAALVNMMRQYSQGVACVAVVTLGNAFYASTTRSQVTGMRLEARGSAKLRFHPTIDEVVTWLPQEHERRTGVHFDPKQLLKTLHDLRFCLSRESLGPPRAVSG